MYQCQMKREDRKIREQLEGLVEGQPYGTFYRRETVYEDGSRAISILYEYTGERSSHLESPSGDVVLPVAELAVCVNCGSL